MAGARIVIVEDNPANRELMSYLLTAFGHSVSVAESGLQGLELSRRVLPDLIVCDVQLPGIGGCEVVRLLREEPSCKAIPVVAVTALAMFGDRERVMAAGFDGYLPKPIDPEVFVGQIEVFLPLRLRTQAPGPLKFQC